MVDRIPFDSSTFADEETENRTMDSVRTAFDKGQGHIACAFSPAVDGHALLRFSSLFEADGNGMDVQLQQPGGSLPRLRRPRQDHRHRRVAGHPQSGPVRISGRRGLLEGRGNEVFQGRGAGQCGQIRIPGAHPLQRPHGQAEKRPPASIRSSRSSRPSGTRYRTNT